jgi:hypothetical protein
MSAVDVLTMLDAYALVPCTWGRNHDCEEIAQARAAVAELIAADEEYDAASREEHVAEEADDDELQCNAVRRMQWARDRRPIAISRCKGVQA